MAEVYIDGFIDENSNSIHCTVPSAIVLFTQAYCGRKSVKKLIFVQSESPGNCYISVPYAASDLPAHSFVDNTSIDERIKACVLPAAILNKQFLLTAGLCSVLRHMVKNASVEYPNGEQINLLGHKGMCLKSCAEVSAWTKYCEVEIISTTEKIISQSEKPRNKTEHEEIGLPNDIFKLESHLKESPIIHNIGKKRREFLKTNVAEKPKNEQGNSTITAEKSVECMNEFLKHKYAEGVEFTLTDLVLFYCVSVILREHRKFAEVLEKVVPNVYQWYVRVSKRSDMQKLHTLYDNPLLSKSFTPSGNIVDETNCPLSGDVETTKFVSSVNQKRHGKKKFKTSANEISSILAEIKDLHLAKQLSSHPMGELVQLPWDSFPTQVHPLEGDLPTSRVSRKCEQLENLATAVQYLARPGDRIVDFCSGGGHLGIVVAHLLPDCHVILVENKEESIRRAASRVEKLGLSNVTIYQCNLDYYQGRFDMGICLHACGVATDLVLQRCLDVRASFVICPCCYGNIKSTHTMSYPRSKAFSRHQISYEQYLVLGHGADQTQTSIPTAPLGQQCMVCVDSDRATLAEEHGYKVDICTLKPATCSPKNNLIIGTCHFISIG